jgi:hypothetical protein
MASTKPEVDLSAFPIIRLDHIQYLDDETLSKAKNELVELIDTSDGSNAKWLGYLQKQYDAMNREELNRQAEARIQQLLSGTLNPLETDYNAILSHSTQQTNNKSPRQLKERAEDKDQSVRDSNSWMQQNMLAARSSSNKPVLPVMSSSNPNGSRKRHSSPSPPSSSSSSSASSKQFSTAPIASSSKTQSSMEESSASRGSSANNSRPQVALLDLTASNLEQSKRENSRQQMRETNQNDGKDLQHSESKNEHLTTRSGGAISTTRSGKSKKSNPEDDQPSKKCMDVVYKNFGSVFVVAATEKKKRFIAPKKPTETPEEIKRREKLERYNINIQHSRE